MINIMSNFEHEPIMRTEHFPDDRKECIFCQKQKETVLLQNELAYSILDEYPVTEGHTLIIPKRHVEIILELSLIETESIFLLIKERIRNVETNPDSDILGWNIGINQGEVAGQTIKHFHVHLIPRRKDDVTNPRGGVRGVIPDKQDYMEAIK